MELTRVKSQAYMLCQYIYGARNANRFLADALLLESVRAIIEDIDIDESEGLLDNYAELFTNKEHKQQTTLKDFFKKEVHKVDFVCLVDFFKFQGTETRSAKFRKPHALFFQLRQPENEQSHRNTGGIIVEDRNVAAWGYSIN